MKTIIWIFLIVLIVVLIGCSGSKAGLNDSAVLTKQPKVTELTISPDVAVLPYDASLTITWASENADYCLLNNETVKTAGFVVK